MRIIISVLIAGSLLVFSQHALCLDTSGLLPVEVEGKWGFKDRHGKIVIRPIFDVVSLFGFQEGLAAVSFHGKWGYIDTTGSWVIDPVFDFAERFSEGLAAVNMGGERVRGRYGDTTEGGKWGYIDKTGNVAIPLKFDGAESFGEELAAVEINGQWGYIDKTGRLAIPPKFDYGAHFTEGLAGVYIGRKWSFIDKSGEFIGNLRFDQISFFSEGLAAVRVGSKWGYVNRKGQLVIKAEYDFVMPFSGGEARVNRDGGWDSIDKTGVSSGKWNFAAGSPENSYYYDPKTVARSKDVVRAWTKSASKKHIETTRALYEIDCAKRDIRVLSVIIYGEEGRIIGSSTKKGDWVPIAPGTIGDAYRERLCKKQEAGKGIKGEHQQKQTTK
jgi:hypothetical protein